MTPRQRLRELLPAVIGIDLDALLRAAVNEIEGLRGKLVAQSRHMAEALKSKNDALERVAFKQTELDQRNQTLSESHLRYVDATTKLQRIRDCVPLKWLNLDTPAAVEALTMSERRAQEDLRDANKLLEYKARELDERLKELEKLRPPEPKFRVGQLLMVLTVPYINAPIKVRTRELGQLERSWRYQSEFSGRWFDEANLRALTDEEK